MEQKKIITIIILIAGLIFAVIAGLTVFNLYQLGKKPEIYEEEIEKEIYEEEGVCIYPWTNNGPTAGWKSDKSNLINVCNGKWCWKWDDNLSQWSNTGIPVDISQGLASQIQAASDGTLPWTNNGPTAGWKSDKSNLINVCNGKWCWKYDDNLSQWSNTGIPVDISQGWAGQVQAASDGTLPWTNNGPTAGWKSDKSNLINVCNGKWCWKWDDNLSQWSNTGIPVDISQGWAGQVQAASDGTLPWTNNGPTAGWKSDKSNLINVCNGKWCWKWDDNLSQWSNTGIPVDISQGWANQIQPGGCEIPPSELPCELSFTVTLKPSPSPSSNPSPSPSPSPSPEASPSPSPSPSPEASSSPSPSPGTSPSPSPSPSPASYVTSSPSPSPSPSPKFIAVAPSPSPSPVAVKEAPPQELPSAGTSLPTIILTLGGILLIVLGFVL